MSLTAPDRIYGQYRNKPKAVAWYNIIPSLSQGLCEGAEQVQQTYNLDTASGIQLDIIGAIVVIARNQATGIQVDISECGDEAAECGNQAAECSQAEGAVVNLSDAQYRLVIKSKIAKNNTDATIDDLIAAIQFILTSEVNVTILDNEDMSFSVQVDAAITTEERTLILFADLIPKPQGVRFAGLIELVDVVQVGDDTLQCGDTDAECAGFTIS